MSNLAHGNPWPAKVAPQCAIWLTTGQPKADYKITKIDVLGISNCRMHNTIGTIPDQLYR